MRRTGLIFGAVNGETVVSGQTTLAHANVVTNTFGLQAGSSTPGITLSSATNGTIAGASGTASVNYSYVIPGKAGDDTTLGSGKCTLWIQAGEFATDIYETLTYGGAVQTYNVNASLYVSGNGKLTTENGGGVKVGYVTKSPSAANPFLNFYKV